jgi:ABC-2 type transport system permease protein
VIVLPAAFARRDFRIAWSYRFSFVLQAGTLVFALASAKFMSELLAEGGIASLDAYGGDYFSFVLVGLALNLLALPAVRSFSDAVRGAQVTGTLEAMLSTRSSPLAIIVSSVTYPLLRVLVELVLIVALAAVVLDARVELQHIGLTLAVLVLTVASFAGVGLMSCAFTVAFKQREPLTGAFLTGSLLLSGVIYPTSVLPSWLEVLSPLLPMTHALELTRGLFLEGAEVSNLEWHFAALAAFSALLPLGVWLLGRSIRWARRAGSLAYY